MTKTGSNGFSALEIIIVIGVVAALGGFGWLVWAKHKAPAKQASPATVDTSQQNAPADQVQLAARDVKRKTDINSLAAHVEAFYAAQGYYPTLANLNDPAWRAANMQGLDESALRDPNGTSATLTDSVQDSAYSYTATPSGCDDKATKCASYVLSAKLEAGGIYHKDALN